MQSTLFRAAARMSPANTPGLCLLAGYILLLQVYTGDSGTIALKKSKINSLHEAAGKRESAQTQPNTDDEAIRISAYVNHRHPANKVIKWKDVKDGYSILHKGAPPGHQTSPIAERPRRATRHKTDDERHTSTEPPATLTSAFLEVENMTRDQQQKKNVSEPEVTSQVNTTNVTPALVNLTTDARMNLTNNVSRIGPLSYRSNFPPKKTISVKHIPISDSNNTVNKAMQLDDEQLDGLHTTTIQSKEGYSVLSGREAPVVSVLSPVIALGIFTTLAVGVCIAKQMTTKREKNFYYMTNANVPVDSDQYSPFSSDGRYEMGMYGFDFDD